MKAKAKHKVRQFRVKGLRWVCEVDRRDCTVFSAAVMDGFYKVWRYRINPRMWSDWLWYHKGHLTQTDDSAGGPTAAAAKEAAERDWVVRLSAVLVPVAAEPRKRKLGTKGKEVAR